MNVPERIILSRPDAIGDAVVTLPMAGWIKHHAPSAHITVIAKQYAKAIWERSKHVDRIVTLEDLDAEGTGGVDRLRSIDAGAIVHAFPHRAMARRAKQAGIPRRIGTSHRWWHWSTCNERVDFTRKNSPLHEAQLNLKLLAPFGISMPATAEALIPHIGYQAPALDELVKSFLHSGKRHVVLHPLSKGSAVEWGPMNFNVLIAALDPGKWQVFVTGTSAEADRYRRHLVLDRRNVTDLGGRLTLEQLMQLIGACDALVAASTGPLHIAAASSIRAVGLFSMRRPIHPGRWAPLGRDAHALVNDPACPTCQADKDCDCITRIAPQRVLDLLELPFA
jgi:heptosyltransferase-3